MTARRASTLGDRRRPLRPSTVGFVRAPAKLGTGPARPPEPPPSAGTIPLPSERRTHTYAVYPAPKLRRRHPQRRLPAPEAAIQIP